MVRTRVTGAIVAGLLLRALVATGETMVPSAGSIIPVTGPSMGPGPSEPTKPELIPAVLPPDTKAGHITPKAGASRLATAPPAPRTAKVTHTPASNSTVKKTSATTKHVAKPAGSPKTKHVITTKQKAPVHHTMIGKPVPVTKHQPTAPAAKDGASASPVLPRV